MLLNKLQVVVNLAVANQLAAHQKKGLVARGFQSGDGQAMKPDATLAIHDKPAVVRTAMRDFSKIGLQHIQLVHGNAILGGANCLIIEDAAHNNMTKQRMNNVINYISHSLNDVQKYINIIFAQYNTLPIYK